MSETRLYTVGRNGDVEIYERFRNAHGGSMAIWRILAEKHLQATGMAFTMMMMSGLKPVFDLAKKGNLAPWETVTLMTTFDKVVIPIEHVASVASALEKFTEEYGPAQEAQNFIFHIPQQAEALRKVVEEAEEKGWRGVCWNQMSASEALWDGIREEGEDERRPHNVDKDEGHWYWPENKVDEEAAAAVTS